MNRLQCAIVGSLLGIYSPFLSDLIGSPPAASAAPAIRHHQLVVELLPVSHELIASDELVIAEAGSGQTLTFSLAPTLRVERIETTDACPTPCPRGAPIPFRTVTSPEQTGRQQVVVQAPGPVDPDGLVRLKVLYRGVINDPPRDPRHLRFVTPSETAGHIGPEGVYLSSESEWYPDLEGSLATYDATITVPEGWTAVSQGAAQADPRRWLVTMPSEALTVVANRFVVKSRAWQAKSGQRIELATYLFPEEAALADEYLDASAKYLDAYIPLLGPYPFPKFAVVENFFSSGLGMPSFTLLGSGIIKRHYTQPYALGHEIVHSWIGNGIFNRVDRGNWVEGLTTYLANYYYHELSGDEVQAREQRRLMLLGYGVYVRSDNDYPIGQFTRKSDERDNAIGYQKSAMVFHALRQEVGEVVFWKGIRGLTEQYLGVAAEWKDLERTFQEAAGRDLRWFFAQWVERAGAPELFVQRARLVPPGDGSMAGTASNVLLTVRQGTEAFRMPVDLEFRLASGAAHRVRVQMAEPREDLHFSLPERPLSVRLDPGYHAFRRVARSDMAPMLNLYVTDSARTVISPGPEPSSEPSPFADVVSRIASQEGNKPDGQRTRLVQGFPAGQPLPPGSILVLGGPRENPAAVEALRVCGERVKLTDNGFMIAGQGYEGPSMALIVSCRRDEAPGTVVTLVYGVTPQALRRVARLLFFYGWQSYVVFREGSVVARGDWENSISPEVEIERN